MGDLLVAVCADIPAERVIISERLGGNEWVKLWDAEGIAKLKTGQTLKLGDALTGLTVTSSHDAFLEDASQFNVIVVSSDEAVGGVSAVFPQGADLSPGKWLYTDGTTNSDRCYFDDLQPVSEPANPSMERGGRMAVGMRFGGYDVMNFINSTYGGYETISQTITWNISVSN